MANNKIEIVFNRDFTLDDQVKLLLNIGSLPFVYNFNWVVSPSVGFEVEVATPTATTGEATAINFATAWGNSVTGYTVSQSTNTVTVIGDDTVEFVNLSALDSGGNSYLIPSDYNYTISTETNSLKITYTDKVGTTIPGDAVNQWRDDDANEVKDKHNDTVDVVLQNQTDLAGKADLADLAGKANLSGDRFTGLVELNDGLSSNDNVVFYAGDYTTERFRFAWITGIFLGPVNNPFKFQTRGNSDSEGFDFLDHTGVRVALIDRVGNANFDGSGTFGTEGQSNEIIIKGDTGENVTITKNLDGTLTISNTNNEAIVVDGIMEIQGATSSVLRMTDNGEVLSGTLSYDGNSDEFTFNTELAVTGVIRSTTDISLESGSGDFISRDGSTGFTGTFESLAGDTVTVKNGIITDIS